jgi:hypothetical protein
VVKGDGVTVIPLLFLTICLVAGAAVLWALGATVAMMWNFKFPGDAFSRRTLWNPMNGLLVPQLLTDRGRLLRRHVGYAVSAFIACLALVSLMGLITFLVR